MNSAAFQQLFTLYLEAYRRAIRQRWDMAMGLHN